MVDIVAAMAPSPAWPNSYNGEPLSVDYIDFRNPRDLGEIVNADAPGESGVHDVAGSRVGSFSKTRQESRKQDDPPLFVTFVANLTNSRRQSPAPLPAPSFSDPR